MALTPEQLEMRKKGVFASDMPRIARLLPSTWARTSWGDLFDEKTGAAPAWDGNATTRWGDLVAPIIASEWSRAAKRPVVRHEITQLHPELPFIGATADYLTADDEAAPIECKNVGTFMAKKWPPNKVPDYVEAQVQTQLAVLGKKRGFVAVHFEGSKENTVHPYVVEFNPKAWDYLVALAREFMGYVERNERPTI